MPEQGFLASLFDVEFKSLITTKVIKVLYILSMIVIGLAALAFVAAAFANSAAGGLIVLLIVAPLVALLYLIYVRVLLEIVIAVFRIMETNTELVALQRAHGGGGPGPGVAAPPPPAPAVHPAAAAGRPAGDPAAAAAAGRRLAPAAVRTLPSMPLLTSRRAQQAELADVVRHRAGRQMLAPGQHAGLELVLARGALDGVDAVGAQAVAGGDDLGEAGAAEQQADAVVDPVAGRQRARRHRGQEGRAAVGLAVVVDGGGAGQEAEAGDRPRARPSPW